VFAGVDQSLAESGISVILILAAFHQVSLLLLLYKDYILEIFYQEVLLYIIQL
jgi:hypothetical protein